MIKKSREKPSKAINLLTKIKKCCFKLLISRVQLGQIESSSYQFVNFSTEKSVFTNISCNFSFNKQWRIQF